MHFPNGATVHMSMWSAWAMGVPKVPGYYPKEMCLIVARVLGQLEYVQFGDSGDHQNEPWGEVLGNEEIDPYQNPKGQVGRDPEIPFTEQELKKVKESIRQLHVRSGHPTNRAFDELLKSSRC